MSCMRADILVYAVMRVPDRAVDCVELNAESSVNPESCNEKHKY